MTQPRSRIVDPEVTPFYHCMSRCVRQSHLCGPGMEHRKDWIEQKLRELSDSYCIDVCGYAILDNHLHVLLRIDIETAKNMSDAEVALRWGTLYPPQNSRRELLPVDEAWIAEQIQDAEWVAERRQRLIDLGWFMKGLKEDIARRANREDGRTGVFWEGRYRSYPILDELALLVTMVYIDLNPLAAGMAPTPEESTHTSFRARIDHCREQHRTSDLQAGQTSYQAACAAAAGLEDDLWLFPIQDRRELGDSLRPGLLPGFTLASYVELVDGTSRLSRPDKAHVSPGMAPLLTRLGTTPELWEQMLRKLLGAPRLVGSALGSCRESLEKVAAARGTRLPVNLNGCPVSASRS